MKELRLEFLRETVSSLEILLDRFAAEKKDSPAESLRRELFRRLHSVKGTAQTFGIGACASLAHKIENLLQAAAEKRIEADEGFKLLVLEGVELLLENFRRVEARRQLISPRAFLDKTRNLIPGEASAGEASGLILQNIPPEILAVLSSYEKNLLATSIENGNIFYLIEAFFRFAEFGEAIREFKSLLSEHGEVIASAPAPDYSPGTIGFRFYFAARVAPQIVEKIIKPFDAQMIVPETEEDSESGARALLKQAARAGRQAAQTLGKTVDFEIEANDVRIPARQMNVLFEAAVHLVRNAADHAVETPEERAAAGKPECGKINLSITEEAGSLILRVADDGRGIDAEKIRSQAVARRLVETDADLPGAEVLQTIFAHGFSTSETVTEISGRGVGLDAVRDAAEKAGGAVRVSSERGRGTTFEVRLPKDDEQ